MKPAFWIVAGPNGSGKSTLIAQGDLDRWTGSALRALSPDDVVLRLRAQEPLLDELSLLRQAQAISDTQVNDAITAGQTVMVETVLSSTKFQPVVKRALENGFTFGFVYVIVVSAAVNTARVADRVERGGHDVPTDIIAARRERSTGLMPWFAERATVGAVIENSRRPVVLAERAHGDADWTVFDIARLQHLGLHLDPAPPQSA